jgi:hypothetical protein
MSHSDNVIDRNKRSFNRCLLHVIINALIDAFLVISFELTTAAAGVVEAIIYLLMITASL